MAKLGTAVPPALCDGSMQARPITRDSVDVQIHRHNSFARRLPRCLQAYHLFAIEMLSHSAEVASFSVASTRRRPRTSVHRALLFVGGCGSLCSLVAAGDRREEFGPQG